MVEANDFTDHKYIKYRSGILHHEGGQSIQDTLHTRQEPVNLLINHLCIISGIFLLQHDKYSYVIDAVALVTQADIENVEPLIEVSGYDNMAII